MSPFDTFTVLCLCSKATHMKWSHTNSKIHSIYPNNNKCNSSSISISGGSIGSIGFGQRHFHWKCGKCICSSGIRITVLTCANNVGAKWALVKWETNQNRKVHFQTTHHRKLNSATFFLFGHNNMHTQTHSNTHRHIHTRTWFRTTTNSALSCELKL